MATVVRCVCGSGTFKIEYDPKAMGYCVICAECGNVIGGITPMSVILEVD
jgi:hypothetical protein